MTIEVIEVVVPSSIATVEIVLPGAQGPVGADGPEGPPGPQGPAGPAGADGANGLDGATGAAGPQGPTGNAGPPGPEGPPGPQGLKVRQAPRVPMVPRVLLDLRVHPVPQDPAGSDGAPGPVGPAGADGAPGVAGPPGPAGPAGPAGADGAPGAPGPVGPAGPPAGPPGSCRRRWCSRIQGPAGPMGPTGPPVPMVPGSNGVGVPIGGTTGQILAKIDATDYNTQWVTPDVRRCQRLGRSWRDDHRSDRPDRLPRCDLSRTWRRCPDRPCGLQGRQQHVRIVSDPRWHRTIIAGAWRCLCVRWHEPCHLSLQCVVLHELHQQARDLHREEDVPARGGRRGSDQPRR